MGHGLVGVLAGGHITYVEVFGVKLWPEIGWAGWSSALGRCGVEGFRIRTGWGLHMIAGPLSTGCVSVLAVVLLWLRRWTGLLRVILVCLSFWWIDLLSEALSSWDILHSILRFRRSGVHYHAALELGIPSLVVGVFAIGISACLLTALVIRLICDRRRFLKHPIP